MLMIFKFLVSNLKKNKILFQNATKTKYIALLKAIYFVCRTVVKTTASLGCISKLSGRLICSSLDQSIDQSFRYINYLT